MILAVVSIMAQGLVTIFLWRIESTTQVCGLVRRKSSYAVRVGGHLGDWLAIALTILVQCVRVSYFYCAALTAGY